MCRGKWFYNLKDARACRKKLDCGARLWKVTYPKVAGRDSSAYYVAQVIPARMKQDWQKGKIDMKELVK